METAPIELYGVASPNVMKIMLMFEELELPYAFHFVDVFKGDQFTPEFVRLNPNSKTPVIVDRRPAEPVTVFESGAILIYLAEEAGALLPARGPARAEVMQWLMIQLTGIGPMFGQYVHFTRYHRENAYAESRYRTEAIRLLDVVEGRLGEATWLGGADYSIADIATFPWLRILAHLGLPHEGRPNLKRWLEAVRARPATDRFLRKLKEVVVATDGAVAASTDEGLDRFLGRGRFARVA